MYKIIALMGKAGSGKDTLLKNLITESIKWNIKFNEIISCTSRPKREKEEDGVNYHFVSRDEFETMIKSDEMLEYTEFNNWYYGTPLSALSEDKINICVLNPQGVKNLMQYEAIDMHVYYIIAAPKTRLLRQLNREDSPNVNEIIRRYGTDEKDFLLTNLNFEYS